MQAIEELNSGEHIFGINPYIKKAMQNKDNSKIMNMERTDISQILRIYFNNICAQSSENIFFATLRNFLAKDRNCNVESVSVLVLKENTQST